MRRRWYPLRRACRSPAHDGVSEARGPRVEVRGAKARLPGGSLQARSVHRPTRPRTGLFLTHSLRDLRDVARRGQWRVAPRASTHGYSVGRIVVAIAKPPWDRLDPTDGAQAIASAPQAEAAIGRSPRSARSIEDAIRWFDVWLQYSDLRL